VIPLSSLPTLNAFLNSLSAIFLVTGYFFIRRKNIPYHRICMVAAFTTSVLFLISYLTYHFYTGSTKFPDIPTVRTIYLGILLTHTMLAALVPFLAVITLTLALKQRWEHHRKIAKWTLPIWFYVSVTGVIIYLMLYHLYKA
jgi:protein SCO1/2/putative membrane protein